MNKIGVYLIKNILNNKIYIGSSTNITARIYKHKYLLKKGKHESKVLQDDFNLLGINAFTFEALELVDNKELLTIREQHYIDLFDSSKNGYNTCPFAGKGNKGRVFGEETKEKHRNKWSRLKSNGYDTCLMGNRKPKSESFKRSVSGEKSGRSKLKNEEVEEIRMMLKDKRFLQKEIAVIFNIDRSVISRIKNKQYWRESI